MTADLDTRPDQDYAPADELLPAGPKPAGERPPAAGDFARSREQLETLVSFLGGEESRLLEHGELEDRLEQGGRELIRRLFQDHLDLRAERETRLEEVADREGAARRCAEGGRRRALETVFGEVSVSRIAYRQRGHECLHPADAALNLPRERHSHGLRRLAAVESARGSFADAAEAICRATGQRPAKRQVEELAQRSAADFEAFYEGREGTASARADALCLSADGKGIVMRQEALREATRRRAQKATGKLKTRLSKGEKRNRKRIAEVGAVYDATPAPRTAADILPASEAERAAARAGPAAKGKWLTASVVCDAAEIVGQLFDEGERRDPDHARDWVALVDGNNHQIELIEGEAEARDAPITVLCDFVHVLEYLWGAAWSFHSEGDPAAEEWVRRHALGILEGKARRVAGTIRRRATKAGLDSSQRAGADSCATYLTNKAPYLDYPTALRKGWPIATGVIEGACRHLVKDRMDLTGARWGLDGAEAILRLRALVSDGDFDEYWRFHLARERRRVHESRYADGVIPEAA